MKVIFFDADENLRAFARKHPIAGVDYIFFSQSFNQVSLEKLSPHTDTSIISVFVHSETLDTKKLALFHKLKMILTRSTGINHIDITYCKKNHIQITNVPYYGAQTVAEFAFGLLLNLSRNIMIPAQDMSKNRIHLGEYTGFDLFGKTIGVIGTGSIGQHMIQLAKGFGMKILAFDLFPQESLKQYYVPFDELIRRCDIISLHIPSTPNNRHLLNQKVFQCMKKGVYIINTARGDLIDTKSLYDNIQNGTVAGVGLDVLENEDFLLHDDISFKNYNNQILLDSTINLKLLQHPKVIITPHIAFNTKDALKRILVTTFENIKKFKLECGI